MVRKPKGLEDDGMDFEEKRVESGVGVNFMEAREM